jgi:hypothetical protein
MTANKFAGAMPMTRRLVLRRASNVPDALLGIWRSVWTVLLAILLAIPALFVTGYALNTDVPVWIIGLIISAVVLVFWFGLYRMVARALVNKTTRSLVDVARYLDTSPYSYAARRAIRGGLVDLLHALHDGRYSRIVVVAHGVGTYISYDAMTAFWAQTHGLHAGPPAPAKLGALDSLEHAADRLIADDADGALDAFQDLQFALWQDLREQGNPWRITDFVTVGAPMALADLLVTRPGLVADSSSPTACAGANCSRGWYVAACWCGARHGPKRCPSPATSILRRAITAGTAKRTRCSVPTPPSPSRAGQTCGFR